MNKYQFEDLISDYIENKIKSNDKNDFEDYLKSNKEAQDLVDSIKFNIEAFKKIPKVKVNEDFNEKLLSKVRIKKNKVVKSRSTKALLFGFTRSQLLLSLILVLIFSFTSFEILSEVFYENSNKNIMITNNLDTNLNDKLEGSNNLDSNVIHNSKSQDIDYSKNIKFVND